MCKCHSTHLHDSITSLRSRDHTRFADCINATENVKKNLILYFQLCSSVAVILEKSVVIIIQTLGCDHLLGAFYVGSLLSVICIKKKYL